MTNKDTQEALDEVIDLINDAVIDLNTGFDIDNGSDRHKGLSAALKILRSKQLIKSPQNVTKQEVSNENAVIRKSRTTENGQCAKIAHCPTEALQTTTDQESGDVNEALNAVNELGKYTVNNISHGKRRALEAKIRKPLRAMTEKEVFTHLLIDRIGNSMHIYVGNDKKMYKLFEIDWKDKKVVRWEFNHIDTLIEKDEDE